MDSHNKFHNIPVRIAAGLYLLDSGLSKLSAEDSALEHLHKMATDAYPFLEPFDPKGFSKYFAYGEILLAGGLLLPFVPDAVVGAGLTLFASSLFGLYIRIPGMRHQGSIRPTIKGSALAKNIWLLGIGISLAITSIGIDRRSQLSEK